MIKLLITEDVLKPSDYKKFNLCNKVKIIKETEIKPTKRDYVVLRGKAEAKRGREIFRLGEDARTTVIATVKDELIKNLYSDKMVSIFYVAQEASREQVIKDILYLIREIQNCIAIPAAKYFKNRISKAQKTSLFCYILTVGIGIFTIINPTPWSWAGFLAMACYNMSTAEQFLSLCKTAEGYGVTTHKMLSAFVFIFATLIVVAGAVQLGISMGGF